MKRPIVSLGVTLLVLLSGTGQAVGKEVILRVKACGHSECNLRSSQTVTDYALLNPAIETSRPTSPPLPSPSYSVRIFLKSHGVGTSRVLTRYHPSEGSLQVKGRRGPATDRSQLLVPRRWVALDPDERSAYDQLTEGLAPDPGVRAADLAAAEPPGMSMIARLMFGASETIRTLLHLS